MAAGPDALKGALLERYGRTYAEEAGIRLADKPAPLYQLLVLAALQGPGGAARLRKRRGCGRPQEARGVRAVSAGPGAHCGRRSARTGMAKIAASGNRAPIPNAPA